MVKDKELLEVQIIGAGSAFAKKYRKTSFLVTFPDGYRLLVDCGPDIPSGLEEMRIPLDTIDGLLVTHLHGDHINGIEELAFKNRYIFNRKMDLFVPALIADELWENSLKGGLEHTEEGECEVIDYFNCYNLYEFRENPLGLRILKTDHVKNKLSYAIGFKEGLFYSGDTKFNTGLIQYAYNNYKTIIHDCQLPLENGKVIKGGVHAHLHELMSLPEDIQKKMHLIHYGDNAETFIGRTGKLRFATEETAYLI
jgi:ribonuclease BN (tRNA processing enzyme)